MSLLSDLFPSDKKYKLGYALGGGGAKGFAHLGALKVFEENGLVPEIIAGTSAGALAGGLYADGYAPEEIADFFRGRKMLDFAEFSPFSGGLLKPNGISTFLKKNLRAKTFEQLKIPFVAVATNLETAEVALFSEGDSLVDAIVASCTVPIIFQPCRIGGVDFVDGGVVKNLPVSVIREETECIIGVNLNRVSPYEHSKKITTSALRYFEIISKYNMKEDKEMADVLIDVEGIQNVKLFDLKSIDEIAELGYNTTRDLLKSQELRKKLHLK